MPAGTPCHRRIRSSSAVLLHLALLLSSLAVGSDGTDTAPEDHGLANEKAPPLASAAASPAMSAFFGGGSGGALPQAAGKANATGAVWDLSIEPAPEVRSDHTGSGGRNQTRTALLTAGILCGMVGIGLFAAAVVVYLIQTRRSSSAAIRGHDDKARVLRDQGPA